MDSPTTRSGNIKKTIRKPKIKRGNTQNGNNIPPAGAAAGTFPMGNTTTASKEQQQQPKEQLPVIWERRLLKQRENKKKERKQRRPNRNRNETYKNPDSKQGVQLQQQQHQVHQQMQEQQQDHHDTDTGDAMPGAEWIIGPSGVGVGGVGGGGVGVGGGDGDGDVDGDGDGDGAAVDGACIAGADDEDSSLPKAKTLLVTGAYGVDDYEAILARNQELEHLYERRQVQVLEEQHVPQAEVVSNDMGVGNKWWRYMACGSFLFAIITTIVNITIWLVGRSSPKDEADDRSFPIPGCPMGHVSWNNNRSLIMRLILGRRTDNITMDDKVDVIDNNNDENNIGASSNSISQQQQEQQPQQQQNGTNDDLPLQQDVWNNVTVNHIMSYWDDHPHSLPTSQLPNVTIRIDSVDLWNVVVEVVPYCGGLVNDPNGTTTRDNKSTAIDSATAATFATDDGTTLARDNDDDNMENHYCLEFQYLQRMNVLINGTGIDSYCHSCECNPHLDDDPNVLFLQPFAAAIVANTTAPSTNTNTPSFVSSTMTLIEQIFPPGQAREEQQLPYLNTLMDQFNSTPMTTITIESMTLQVVPPTLSPTMSPTMTTPPTRRWDEENQKVSATTIGIWISISVSILLWIIVFVSIFYWVTVIWSNGCWSIQKKKQKKCTNKKSENDEDDDVEEVLE